jgi:hypothetical protein
MSFSRVCFGEEGGTIGLDTFWLKCDGNFMDFKSAFCLFAKRESCSVFVPYRKFSYVLYMRGMQRRIDLDVIKVQQKERERERDKRIR